MFANTAGFREHLSAVGQTYKMGGAGVGLRLAYGVWVLVAK